MVKEERAAAALTLINFANDIEQLVNAYATYLNVLIRIKDKYSLTFEAQKEGDKEVKRDNDDRLLRAFEGEDQQMLIQSADTFRLYVVRCYFDAKKLADKLPSIKKQIGKIEEEYKKIKRASVVESELLENYITIMSTAFTNDVIDDLIVRAQDVYKEVFE